MAQKIIVGLLGETGSGKDTVAKYLEEKFGAKLMRFADPIKDTLSIYFDKLSKEDQAWMYQVFKNRFGEDILSKAMAKRVDDEKSQLIIINGVRMPSDYEFVKRYPDSQILYVTAAEETRWKRVTARGEKTDDNITIEKFRELDKAETEIHIPVIGSKADKIIRNEKDLVYLLGEVDKYMKELGVSKKVDDVKVDEVEENHLIIGKIPIF
jgi:dephospho-CoA kinase